MSKQQGAPCWHCGERPRETNQILCGACLEDASREAVLLIPAHLDYLKTLEARLVAAEAKAALAYEAFTVFQHGRGDQTWRRGWQVRYDALSHPDAAVSPDKGLEYLEVMVDDESWDEVVANLRSTDPDYPSSDTGNEGGS